MLFCLFVSTFALKSSFKIKVMTFLFNKFSRREVQIQSMSSMSTTDLVRPLVDRESQNDGESQNEEHTWRFQQSMLEMEDLSYA